MGRKLTTEEFVARAKAVHGDKYNYDKVVYTRTDVKVTITCPIHGVFEQRADSHINYGMGCKKCGVMKGAITLTKNPEVGVGHTKDQLTVIKGPYKKATASGKSYHHVLVQCSCGVVKEMLKSNYTKDCVTSCGCSSQAKLKKYNASRIRDLTGQRFGKLTVLGYEGIKGKGASHYTVKCACGREPFSARGSALTSGNTSSCWVCRGRAAQKTRTSLKGRTFGRLTVLRDWGSSAKGAHLSLCECDCGVQTIVQNNNLGSGNTDNCGNHKVGDFRDTREYLKLEEEWANSPCFVYLVPINGKYLKVGIAKDPEKRADGYYGDYQFISPELTRAEAWAVEQRLLFESLEAKPNELSEEYDNWGGRTELRLKESLPAQWYINRFYELMEELAEVGWEELYLQVK
jgi:hypothetical protein